MDEESEEVIVASFPRNIRGVVCVGINEYKGKTLIFIRVYVPSLSGDLTPTKEGISLEVEKSEELINGIRALGDVMSSEKLVAQIQKNDREEIRISLTVYKENPLIQIRTYASYGKDKEFVPTKKGLAMSVNLLPQLLESVEKLSVAVDMLKKVE